MPVAALLDCVCMYVLLMAACCCSASSGAGGRVGEGVSECRGWVDAAEGSRAVCV